LNTPIIRKQTRYGIEADPAQSPVVVIETKVDGEVVIPAGVSPEAINKDYQKELAFLEEVMTIFVHPPQDPNDTTRFFSVGVNESEVYIMVGRPVKVRRKHVNQLLKARPDVVTHRTDDPGDRNPNRLTTFSMAKYNFDVIEDTAQGRTWLVEARKKYASR